MNEQTKILLLTILIVGFYKSTDCQVQYLLPDANAEWEYKTWDAGGDYIFHQYIQGKETRNESEYTVYFVDKYNIDPNTPEPVDTIKSYTYKILISERDGSIFKIDENSDEEVQIFDSNWKVGDTIIDHSAFIDSMYILSRIDTINYAGRDRKRWVFNPLVDMDIIIEFIEGIGGTKNHILKPIFNYQFEEGGGLICFKENNELILSDGCYFITSREEYPYNDKISVYPNPVNKTINIEIQDCMNYPVEMSIINVKGSREFSTQLTESCSSVNLPDNLSGIYLLRLVDNGITYSIKIYIENQ